jgi:hypothetical protein
MSTQPNFTKRAIALFLRGTHIGIVFFVLFGFLSPWPIVLKVHAVFVPLMILQWKLNQGMCALTNFEHWLKREPAAKPSQDSEDQFIKSLLRYFKDPPPSDQFIEKGIHAFSWTCWLFSIFRLLI